MFVSSRLVFYTFDGTDVLENLKYISNDAADRGSRPIRFGYPNPRHVNPISRGLSRGNGSRERYTVRREDARFDGTADSIDMSMHLARGGRVSA